MNTCLTPTPRGCRWPLMRSALVGSLAALMLSLLAPSRTEAQTTAPRRQPNVVLIVADDLGYADLGCQGLKEIPTPNIDSIAAQGVRFTNGYVTCPVCSPTRAGLLTGRYQQRFGHEHNPVTGENDDPNFGLPVSQATIADHLKAAGYATGIVGKWHLGYRSQFTPMNRGFDEFYGFLGGHFPYMSKEGMGGTRIQRGDKIVNPRGYLTDVFAQEAVDFIGRHKAQPFFLYLAFNAVHGPMEAPADRLQRLEHIADPQRRTFLAMLSALDDGVGRVLEALREAGLDRDTLLVFIADNGGPTSANTSRNDPLRGFKGQLLEGGIRVPIMMRWTGTIPAGRVVDAPVISLDIAATALSSAKAKGQAGTGAEMHQLDGRDLLPLLTGREKALPGDGLFWRYGSQWAVRSGDWKLVKTTRGREALYNLAQDLGEMNDLSSSQDETAARLKALYEVWNAQNVPPRWGPEVSNKFTERRRAATRAATTPATRPRTR